MPTARTLINRNSGKIIGALISKGFYDIVFSCRDDKTVIDVSMYPGIRFSTIVVYEDVVHCYTGNKVEYEMRAGSKKQIIDDLTK